MSADLRADSSKSIREFVICPNPRVIFNSAKPRFAYYESEHSNLRVFVDRLHEAGYVSDVTVGNAPIYRMTEAFVESLLKNAG
jgi:hypothetical protein